MQLRKLRIVEVPRAVEVAEAAFQDDPMFHYFCDVPDTDSGPSRFWTAWRLHNSKKFATRITVGQTWTVGEVYATLVYTPAHPGGDPADGFNWTIPYIRKVSQQPFSQEQKKRFEESNAKFGKAIADVLGHKKNALFYVDSLATSPAHQGHGYASALVRMVTSQADAEGRDTWLMSSNILNEGFYNSLGFVSLADSVLGDDNPTWDKPPVVVKLMVRKREWPEELGSRAVC